ncbi:DUF2971 domain-containing protein [Streptococcus dysgalactiae subsp. dysgalactiae]|nr:DUF2971 domain-containing protein [Streptococcus dysgalactiae]QGG97918.1 DUF2971 domain-containing protein [Streptococcus dysgalactiae subsp. dysgalactiae]
MYTLFHYTSIKTLELILRNQTFRFQSLNFMDDPNEKKTSDFGDIGGFHFVSCWTSIEEESIPQWDRYGDDSRGVRININFERIEEVFNTTQIILDDGSEVKIAPFLNPYTCPMLPSNGYLPKIIEVNYSKNSSDFVPSVYKYDGKETLINLGINGKTKSYFWEFQKEVRFDVMFLPWSKNELEEIWKRMGNFYPILFPAMLKEATLPLEYFDLKLNKEIFRTATLTFGPKATNEDIQMIKDVINELDYKIPMTKSKIEMT